MTKRLLYLFLTLTTIVLGLLSRKWTAIPSAAGDLLYAVMIYWIVRFLSPTNVKKKTFYFTLAICFGIEFLQLLDTSFLVALRHHRLLRLVFGQGFLWTDLLAYIMGAAIAWGIDSWAEKLKFKSQKSKI